MPDFRRRGQHVQVMLRGNEIGALRALTGELIELINPLGLGDNGDELDAMLAALGGDDSVDAVMDDPALLRLFPDAYRDDPSASRDFRRYTQSDQAIAKVEAARTMLTDLAGADEGWVLVPSDHVKAWLVTLTNLRLVLAVRLGVERDEDWDALARLPGDDPRAPTVAVYDWCGWTLESLVQCL